VEDNCTIRKYLSLNLQQDYKSPTCSHHEPYKTDHRKIVLKFYQNNTAKFTEKQPDENPQTCITKTFINKLISLIDSYLRRWINEIFNMFKLSQESI